MNGEYCYPSSHLLPDEVRYSRIIDGGDVVRVLWKLTRELVLLIAATGAGEDLGFRLLRECVNSIRRMSVFVSRQLRKDEKTKGRKDERTKGRKDERTKGQD